MRWCPGCGDYAILSAVQQVFPELGIPREKFVVVSGIGCSSRFPYYMNTFGFHTIHGRAPAVATGLKLARPELEVWIATGDGDSMSIGGNHLIHVLRRNVGVKILMFNNRIYGLTKGQYSPTSELGKKTKSTPAGSVDYPFNPLALALGAGATFIARSVDVFQSHLRDTLRRAARHKGTAYVEIYQNCNIFNDKAFSGLTDKETKDDTALYLEHGKPLIFGKNKDRGIRMQGTQMEVVELGGEFGPDDCLVWDETQQNPATAFLAAQLQPPHFPTPSAFSATSRWRPTRSGSSPRCRPRPTGWGWASWRTCSGPGTRGQWGSNWGDNWENSWENSRRADDSLLMAGLFILAHGGSWDMRFQISSLAASEAAAGERVDVALFFGALDAWVRGRWDELDPQPPLTAERLEALNLPPLSEMLAAGRQEGLIRLYACSASARMLGLDTPQVQASVDAFLGWQSFSRMIRDAGKVVTL